VASESLNLARVIFGHLTGTECRRGLARGWLLWLRALVGMLLASCLMFVIWSWWLSSQVDSNYRINRDEIKMCLSAVALVMLTITAVQAPAVLAGSLAGERERGILQLLLTTTASPREIVFGRLIGKLAQVGMIIVTGLPVFAFLAPLGDVSFLELLAMALLLLAVGFGAGGLAVGASVVSRRSRDAQLTVYILMVLLMLSPMLGWLGLPREAVVALEWFNPYASITRLIAEGETARALASAACWAGLGAAGVAVAIWRLRPSCLSIGVTLAKTGKRRKAPPLRERPMLWKELFIERVTSLGRIGRWLGFVLTLLIGGGSLVLAAMIGYTAFVQPGSDLSLWAMHILTVVLGGFAGTMLGWLLHWGIGLRAAVSIASERERGTWDALLMSTLTPGEIAVSKLVGSLYALRWMAAAMLLAWTLAVIVKAVTVESYVTWVVGTLAMGSFMAAIGVRFSLSLPTATKAMSWTIALWLVIWPIVAMVALALIGLVAATCMSYYLLAISYGWIGPRAVPWFPMSFATGWAIATNATTFLFTLLIVADTSLRFDRIAGRMAGGTVATTVDAMVHGTTHKAVFLPDKKAVKKKKSRTDPSLDAELATPSA
jgi:ABC-type Na+ efflux pump permease subunit